MYNENLGAIIKIYEFLTLNHINVINVIGDENVRTLLQYYFKNLIYSPNGFPINVKNNNNTGLIINYMHMYDKIPAEFVFIAPWSSLENPLLIFEYSKKYRMNKNLIYSQYPIHVYFEYNRYYEQWFIPFVQLPIILEQKTDIIISSDNQEKDSGKEDNDCKCPSDDKLKDLVKVVSKKIGKLNAYLE